MKKRFLLLTAVIFSSFIFAQSISVEDVSAENNLSASAFSGSVQQAMSSADYMVTAGDVYSLTYAANGSPVSYTIPVDPSYKIRVSNLAVLDASGKSYIALKKQVEEIVQKNFPMSGVQFVLRNPASFKVVVNGEVTSTAEINAWALTRLSSVIQGITTDYSSIRDVTVTSAKGKKSSYDLFKAQRFGELSQNPYVRPGDVITINRIRRVVNISGAVERPGKYELMKGENLKQLIEYYGNGLTELADTSRITLIRNRNSKAEAGDTVYLDKKAIDSNYELYNGDVISIGNKTDLKPTIIVEGIINNPDANADNATNTASEAGGKITNQSYRTKVSFYDGENYATLVRRISGMFSTLSDLQNAYVERNGNRIPMNLEEMIYDRAYMSSYKAENNDKLVIPYQQNFSKVFITGEVNTVKEEEAWPLRRLSEVIKGNTTEYSSTRKVNVTTVDGKTTTYDLFLASRYGDMSQDPYIRQGETVTVQRRGRKVTVEGSVERPGSYELLEGDNLRKLVEYYGSGLTELADTSRITLVRNREAEGRAGDKIYLDEKAIKEDYKLNNGDHITIASISELMSSIVVEGIINNPNAKTVDNADTIVKENAKDTIYRTKITFYDGENYATLFRRIKGMFSSYSDLENAYVERSGKKIPQNLEYYIYNPASMSEFTVKANDKLVIPFQQHFQKVLIKGEVNRVVEEEAWPLRRLSAVIQGNTTEYSSIRDVQVISVDGITSTYDLFKADRFGDMTQNPYVRAGETVVVNRFDRKVTIDGAVERPGTYQILKGENLAELISYYAHGLAPQADTSRIEVTRYNNVADGKASGEKLYLSQKDIDSNYELLSYDAVTVSSYRSLMPVMFIEGAVGDPKEGTALESSNRLTVQFNHDTNYAYLIRSHSGWFNNAVSDNANAYILRDGKTIPININQMLYNASFYSDLIVQENDTLIVPFKQYFVSVSGSVRNPGRYPYIPDRTWDYYIGLAGGFIRSENTGESVTIHDMNGKPLRKSDIITPESTIVAETNSFTYFFNKYAPIVNTTLQLILTGISLWVTLSRTTGQ